MKAGKGSRRLPAREVLEEEGKRSRFCVVYSLSLSLRSLQIILFNSYICSVSMACKTLARLCHGPPLDEEYMQVTPPVVHSVIPLCKIGIDDTGNKLLSLLENSGVCRNVDTRYTRIARQKDPSARTALAVLPIYKDGRRGCFFDGKVHFELVSL